MHVMDRRFLPFAAGLAALGMMLAACSGGGGGGGGGTTDPQFGTVSGTVMAGGTGVAGATVSVQGGPSTTTSASGQFTLNNVAVGARNVVLTVPAGFITVSPADPTTKGVTVAANQTAQTSFNLKRGVVVTASGTSFSPSAVTIPVGSTVRWVNGGGSHTVTPGNPAQAGVWSNTDLGPGATFEHEFGTAATYAYHCQPHQSMGMTGSVTVQ
jgi:plastocyanin